MRICAANILIAASLLAHSGWAQQATAPAAPGPVEPRRPNWVERKVSDLAWRPMPAADRAVFLARWAEYDRLLARAESMARPQGFTVAPGALAYGEGEPSRLLNFYVRYIFLAGTVTSGEDGRCGSTCRASRPIPATRPTRRSSIFQWSA
jgi:hypothetical protein